MIDKIVWPCERTRAHVVCYICAYEWTCVSSAYMGEQCIPKPYDCQSCWPRWNLIGKMLICIYTSIDRYEGMHVALCVFCWKFGRSNWNQLLMLHHDSYAQYASNVKSTYDALFSVVLLTILTSNHINSNYQQ